MKTLLIMLIATVGFNEASFAGCSPCICGLGGDATAEQIEQLKEYCGGSVRLQLEASTVEEAEEVPGSFISSGVGKTYFQSIDGMFKGVREHCAKEHQFAQLVSQIYTFNVGTFRAVRAYFVCSPIDELL